jgi:hypothetical protein
MRLESTSDMAKYGKKAAQKVERAMHERKRGTTEERPFGQTRHQPKAGDCDWPVRSAEGGRQSAAQARVAQAEFNAGRDQCRLMAPVQI